jgi:hypothetical protein
LNEAGRAFRSILMNIRQIKGETEDGEIIDDEALSKSAKALDSVGIKVHELKNGIEVLRNPMEVLKDLANVWDSLGKGSLKQSQIIEALGGKYRGNMLTALVENWTMYEKMLTEYAEASGSALIENEKRMSSWQTKAAQFTNAVSNMWNDTIDTDTVKNIIDLGTGIINLIDKVGLLRIAVSGLVVYLAVFNKELGITLLKGLWSVITLLPNLIMNFKGTTAAIMGSTVAVKAFQTALTFGLSFLITEIIASVIEYTENQKKLTQAVEEYNKILPQTTELIKQYNDSHDVSILQLVIDKINEENAAIQVQIDLLAKRNSSIQGIVPRLITGAYGNEQDQLRDLRAEQAANVIRKRHMEDMAEAEKKKLQATEEASKATEKARKKAEELNKAYEDGVKVIDNYQSSSKELASIFDQLSEGEKISGDAILDLIQLYPDYADQIVNINSSKETGISLTETLFEVEKLRAIQKAEDNATILEGELAILEATAANVAAQTTWANSLPKEVQLAIFGGSEYNDRKAQLDAIKKSIEYIRGLKIPDFSTKKPKADKTPPSPINTDLSSEYTKQANAQVEIDQNDIKHIDNLISIAAKQKDYNKELDLTQQKIALQKKTIDDLKKANVTLNQSAISSRKSFSGLGSYYSKMDTESWFDKNGQASKAYLDLIGSFNGKTDALSKQRLDNIQKEFDELQKLKLAYYSNVDAIGSMNDGLLDTQQKVEDIAKTQFEATQKLNDEKLKTYDESNKTIIDLLKERYDNEEKLRSRNHEDTLQSLDDQLDAFKDYVDKQKDEIDRLYDTQDYQENVADSSKKILEYQAEIAKRQMAAKSGDLIAQSEIKDYEEKLAEERKGLTKTQRDREKDLRKQNLDDTLSTFEKSIEAQKRTENDSFESYKRSLEDRTTQTALELEAQKLLMTGTIADVQNALVKLFTDVGANATIVGQILQTQLISKLGQLRDINNNLPSITANSSNAISESDYRSRIGTNADYYDSMSGMTRAEFERRHGFVGGGVNTMPGLYPLHGKSNSVETIFNATQGKKLFDFINNLPNVVGNFNIKAPSMPNFTPATSGATFGDIKITVNGSVTDANVNKLSNNITTQLKNVFTQAGIISR